MLLAAVFTTCWGWKYCEEYIRASNIPREMFPEIIPSTEIVGTLTFEAAKALGLPDTVKVACGAVDNSCMGSRRRVYWRR